MVIFTCLQTIHIFRDTDLSICFFGGCLSLGSVTKNHSWVLINNRNLFIRVWETGKFTIKVLARWGFGEGLLSDAYMCHHLSVFSHGGGHGGFPGVCFIRALILFVRALHLQDLITSQRPPNTITLGVKLSM